MSPKARRLLSATSAFLLGLPILAPLACSVPEGVELNETDAGRMAQFDQSRTRGLGEALLGQNLAERQIVSALFAPDIARIETIPDGDYRCRTIKLGGLMPLISYTYFACTISEDGARIEKTSGSQRFSGSLTPSDEGLFYQGALHYNDDPLLAYDDNPEHNQVGCLYRVGEAARYRLEMPYPFFESTHDVIELVPAD